MSPNEFITGLSAHYAKRHESPEAKQIWIDDIIATVKGNRPDVLRKAYDIIREEHEERAFPLPATISKAIRRAAETISPASAPLDEKLAAHLRQVAATRRLPDSPEQIAASQAANAWQREQIEKYGSWENYNKATRRAPSASAPSATRDAPLIPDVSKPAFEAMQNASPNHGLHMTRQGLTDISKRMAGEHTEDAA